ncbi:hypothetical protein [Sporohalobacter salinus]|uniref:hypothetical protein n=1 Tax=Sporohalobacter salinus TaxID=1494606 RepID=UPI001960929D|nr:hypothetical protein [Sporohalobacter salinus]MBM7623778.1 hypothetical protein [Sporohalobacter salinus]
MNNYKKSFLLLISLLVVFLMIPQQVEGCTHSMSEYITEHDLLPTDITFVLSNVGYDPFLEKYFYVTADMYKEDEPPGPPEIDTVLADMFIKDEDELKDYRPMTDKEVNLKEWQEFIGVDLFKEDISLVIYSTPLSTLKSLSHSLQQHSKSVDEIPGSYNKFLRYIYNNNLFSVLEYIIYAKKCEPIATYQPPRWGEEQNKNPRDPKKIKQLIEQGFEQYKTTEDDFLKLRYGYQIVRLANYSDKYEACINYYNQLIGNLNVNSVYRYHALRHKTGALLKSGQTAKYLLLTSLIFDQCPQLMNRARKDFFVPRPEEWKGTLKQTNSDHRKATLWLLRAIETAPRINLKTLKKLYQLEPNSSRLEFLLLFQLNTIEKELLTSEFFFATDQPNQSAVEYIKDLNTFVTDVDTSRVRRPEVWYLTAGYLNILLHKFDKANNYLQQAEKVAGDELIEKQIDLLYNLSALVQTEVVSSKLENDVVSSLTWLNSLEERYNHTMVYRSILILLAQKYFEEGKVAKGYCLIDRTGYSNLAREFLVDYCSHNDLKNIISFLEKPNKNRFEKFITTDLNYSLDYMYYANGSKYLNEGKFEQALKNLKESTINSKNSIHTSFKTNYYDSQTGLYDYSDGGFKAYNKYSFTKEVYQLRKKAQENPDQAGRYYYQIANGYFHSPDWWYYYGGNDILMYSKDNPKYPFYVEEIMNKVRDFDSWYSVYNPTRTIAWKYYDKAMRKTEDKELAAKCCFLAAAAQTEFSGYDSFEPQKKNREYYYRMLNEKYSDTKFYQEVIKECTTLNEFLNN